MLIQKVHEGDVEWVDHFLTRHPNILFSPWGGGVMGATILGLCQGDPATGGFPPMHQLQLLKMFFWHCGRDMLKITDFKGRNLEFFVNQKGIDFDIVKINPVGKKTQCWDLNQLLNRPKTLKRGRSQSLRDIGAAARDVKAAIAGDLAGDSKGGKAKKGGKAGGVGGGVKTVGIADRDDRVLIPSSQDDSVINPSNPARMKPGVKRPRVTLGARAFPEPIVVEPIKPVVCYVREDSGYTGHVTLAIPTLPPPVSDDDLEDVDDAVNDVDAAHLHTGAAHLHPAYLPRSESCKGIKALRRVVMCIDFTVQISHNFSRSQSK